jgi:hypothetical protein
VQTEQERQMSNDDAQAPPSPDPALERLDRLVGTWTLKGNLVGSDEENIRGEISFQWLGIGYDPETESFASFVYSNFAPTPLPYKWDLRDDTLTISVSHGPLDASFSGEFSEDGDSFSGGWRPNPGADETINIPYDVSGARVHETRS